MATHLILSELNGIIQQVLNDAVGMQSFWVVADITEHMYKESTAIILNLLKKTRIQI